MSTNPRIRIFQTQDLPRLQAITADTFGPVSIDKGMEALFGSFGEGGWKDRKLAAIAEDCRVQPDGVFVAEHQSDGVIGYVTTRLDLPSSIGRIPNLAVDPQHQGRGLGRALLQHALAFFRQRGMQIAKIETLAHNDAGQALYTSLGFREVARQIHFAMKIEP